MIGTMIFISPRLCKGLGPFFNTLITLKEQVVQIRRFNQVQSGTLGEHLKHATGKTEPPLGPQELSGMVEWMEL